jgi:hypothetical protein
MISLWKRSGIPGDKYRRKELKGRSFGRQINLNFIPKLIKMIYDVSWSVFPISFYLTTDSISIIFPYTIPIGILISIY